MTFKRARSIEHKNVRIDQIVDAAIKQYESIPFDQITIASIAKELDFTRGNLYKYFSTKEEIYIKVIEKDFTSWITELEDIFEINSVFTLNEFAVIWSKTLYKQQRLIKLLSILFSVLEKNVTIEKLTEFKVMFFNEMPRVFGLLKNQFPGLSQEKLDQYITMQMAYAMGLYPMTTQSDIQKEAVKQSGMNYQPPNFVDSFAQFIVISIEGLSKD